MNHTSFIPGSKSILQRIMTLMALLCIDLDITNYNPCSDVLELENALKAFGYQVSGEGTKRSFRYNGRVRTGMYHFQASGTAFRLFMAALASMKDEHSSIIASETLIHRGYRPLMDALNQMNAKITLRGNEFQIDGAKLTGNHIQMDGKISSQYVSALLLASVNMDNPLIIMLPHDQVSLPYIDLTIRILRSFGAHIYKDNDSIAVYPSTLKIPKEISIDPDASTLAWHIAKAILGTKEQQIPFANTLPQADCAMLEIAQRMGARVDYNEGMIHIHPSKLKGNISIDLKHCPDLMPILSILALFCDEPLTLSGVSRLQYKESNRLLGITNALALIEAKYKHTEDEICIFPYRTHPPKVVLDTLGDHRLVMAFSLLADRYPSVELSEWDSLKKSVPESFLPTDYL